MRMTPVQFLGFAQSFKDPMLLIEKSGEIIAANHAAQNKLGLNAGLDVGRNLQEFVVESAEVVANHVRVWSRSSAFTPVKLSIKPENLSPGACLFHGAAVRGGDQDISQKPAGNNLKNLIMLRILPVHSVTKGFVALNDKIAELKKEILARRRAQAELIQKEAHLQSIFNSIPDSLVVVDVNRQIVGINPAAVSLFGYTIEELSGNTTKMLYKDPDDYSGQGKKRFNVKSQAKSDAYEIEYRRKDGSIFWGETLGTKVVDESGEVLGFIGIIRDVTQRKKIERELEHHREGLEELVKERTVALEETRDELVRKGRLATLGQLTATVSHELRNPLGAMRPSLYLISKQTDPTNEQVSRSISRIERNIERCDHIIDELLDYTRIKSLELQTTAIDRWLKVVVGEINIPRGVDVEYDLQLNDFELQIDVSKLRRVVINVVENAFQSMYAADVPGEVTEGSRMKISTLKHDGRVEISVSDTGGGISGEVLEKIFEPLFSTKGFGVGLGLPVVKQILEQHGGGIEITSEVGKGTTMTLWLPVRRSDKIGGVSATA